MAAPNRLTQGPLGPSVIPMGMSSWKCSVTTGVDIPVFKNRRVHVCVCVSVFMIRWLWPRESLLPQDSGWSDGGERRRKSKELFVPSFTNPFGGKMENISLALSEISACPGNAWNVLEIATERRDRRRV